MTDSLNELGKIIKGDDKTADIALRRLHKKKAKVERANDFFDPEFPFEMEFVKEKNLNTVLLDLIFKCPVPSQCCAGDMCSNCEVFNAGEELITLDRPYAPGSITVRVNGRQVDYFTETNPEAGVVTLTTDIPVGATVRVCYIYAGVTVSDDGTTDGSGGGTGAGSPGAGGNPGVPSPPPPSSPPPPGTPPPPPPIPPVPGPGVGDPPTPPITVVPSGQITVTGNNVLVEGKIIRGSTQDGGSAINALGTVNNPITNLTIRNCTIQGFRLSIYMRFVNNFLIENCLIEDADYVGIIGFSCNGGVVKNNTVRRIGYVKDPATAFQGNNAYGITFNRTESNSLITDPESANIDIIQNTVEDVPLWMCFNLHAGNNIRLMYNMARRAPRAYFFAGSQPPGIAQVNNLTVIGNEAQQCVTKAGGSQDKEGILIASVQTATITDNKIGQSYQSIVTDYQGNSTNITQARNVSTPY